MSNTGSMILAHTVRLLLVACAFSCATALHAQDIENVIVETYYVSDADDATDITSGGLVEGSRTYRVYLDLCDDCALRAIYGAPGHPLIIQSTALLFNHLDNRGKVYGHEINNGALDEGTVALDSWLSLGAASNQKFGILKADDPDGSIVGVGNDGGSAAIPEGLLQNTDASAGYPLFERDGLVPLNGGSALPPTFNVQGDDPTHALKDSTLVNEFVSDSIHIGCSTPGTIGPTAENRVLIAQITTAGDLTLEFNVEVEHADGTTARYMARDTLLAPDETANGLLVYPPSCGCTDPNFLEYDPAAGCDDGSCATTIVFGCLDPTACNYDPNANFNVNELCCYGPTDCNGLDVTIVCPDVSVNDPYAMPTITVGPVPTSSTVDIRISGSGAVRLRSSLSDALGRTVLQVDHGTVNGSAPQVLHMEQLPAGIYHLHLDADGRRIQRTICKY